MLVYGTHISFPWKNNWFFKKFAIFSKRLSTECTNAILKELESLVYEFDANDPSELFGTRLYFYRDTSGLLIANGIVIEGIEMINDDQLGLVEVKVTAMIFCIVSSNQKLTVEKTWKICQLPEV